VRVQSSAGSDFLPFGSLVEDRLRAGSVNFGVINRESITAIDSIMQRP